MLVPELRPGDIVLMNNRSSQNGSDTRALTEAAERTADGLWAAISRIADLFTPDECANYFAACGYDPDR